MLFYDEINRDYTPSVDESYFAIVKSNSIHNVAEINSIEDETTIHSERASTAEYKTREEAEYDAVLMDSLDLLEYAHWQEDEVHYRLYRSSHSEQIVVICVQDFDYIDYDEDRFHNEIRYDSENQAEFALWLEDHK